MSYGSPNSRTHSPPDQYKKKKKYSCYTTENCDLTGGYIPKAERALMTQYVDSDGDVYLPNVQNENVPKNELPEHRKYRLPIGAQEHLDAYSEKKAERFIKNCSKPHDIPRLPPTNYSFTPLPTVSTVSGTPYGLYQVFKSTPYAHVAIATHHLMPENYKFVEINENSWITDYCNRDGTHISPLGRLLNGDLVTVKWAELREGVRLDYDVGPYCSALAREIQVSDRMVLKDQIMGVVLDQKVGGQTRGHCQVGGQNPNLAVIADLPYPVKLSPKMLCDLGKVYRADVFIPVKSEFGDFKFLNRTPETQIITRRVDIPLSKLAKIMMSNKDEKFQNFDDLEDLVRLGSAIAQHKIGRNPSDFAQIEAGFFKNIPEGSNAKTIMKTIFTGSPAPRTPLENQFEDSQMDYVQKMLQKTPLVIGTFLDPRTPLNQIYSTLARCAGCLGEGTHLVVARDYCSSKEISCNIKNPKTIRFTGKLEPEKSRYSKKFDYPHLLYHLLVNLVTENYGTSEKITSTVIRQAVLYLLEPHGPQDPFPLYKMSQNAQNVYEEGSKNQWIPEYWLNFYLDYCSPSIVITDRANLTTVVDWLKNVKSVQFEGIFDIPDDVMTKIFSKFPDANFGFVGKVERDTVDLEEFQGLAQMSLQYLWRRAVQSGKFTVVGME